jgi:glutamate synthase (NADPH/NADH) small chain
MVDGGFPKAEGQTLNAGTCAMDRDSSNPFLSIPRRAAPYREVQERLADWREVECLVSESDSRRQATRCMECGLPFCHAHGCPLGNLIPDTNRCIREGRWREALDLLLETNNFPEFTGRVCPAPCETSCVLGLNREPVTIRNNERAIIELAFLNGWVQPRPPACRLPGRVAVIGSGPAGLAAADSLNRMGHPVTLYDDDPRPGGILRYGIPEFKLEKRIVDRRVDLMRAEGVIFEMGVRVGEDISSRYLQTHFDAICLAGGAREPRDLKVPGRELKGIHFALDFLRAQNLRLDGDALTPGEDILAAGRNVVVIGGGDTGSDCLGTSLRQGARSVRQFEILPEPPPSRDPGTPWPAWPRMRRDSSSHHEGGERRWSVTTVAFLGDADGHLAGLRCAQVEWGNDAGGHPVPRARPGSEFDVQADLVLIAMGFTGAVRGKLLQDLGVTYDARGNVQRDAHHLTSVSGVFASGDLTRGASLVVHAIADGRAAAEDVHQWLG